MLPKNHIDKIFKCIVNQKKNCIVLANMSLKNLILFYIFRYYVAYFEILINYESIILLKCKTKNNMYM